MKASDAKRFRMPRFEHLVEYYKKNAPGWFQENIDDVIETQELDENDRTAKKDAFKILMSGYFKEKYDDLKRVLESIIDGKPVFRSMDVPNAKEYLDKARKCSIDEFGNHWTDDIRSAWKISSIWHGKGEPVVLEAIANIECIDIETTYCFRVYYEEEREIFIEEENAKCNLIITAIYIGKKRYKI